jgi:hypothetical protein
MWQDEPGEKLQITLVGDVYEGGQLVVKIGVEANGVEIPDVLPRTFMGHPVVVEDTPAEHILPSVVS